MYIMYVAKYLTTIISKGLAISTGSGDKFQTFMVVMYDRLPKDRQVELRLKVFTIDLLYNVNSKGKRKVNRKNRK